MEMGADNLMVVSVGTGMGRWKKFADVKKILPQLGISIAGYVNAGRKLA
jgi:hypothetical protein